MSDHDAFDQEFRRRALTMRRTPANRNWNRIEHRLDRRGKNRTVGLRPWMIAAVLFIFAGVGALLSLPGRGDNPLAQRAQSIEELNVDYRPDTIFQPRSIEYTQSSENVDGQPELRLRVAPKYRM